MAKMMEIDWNPDRRTLRQFGWIALGGFGLLAALAWFEVAIFTFGLGSARPWVAGTFAGLGALAALFSLVAPRGNRPLFVGTSLVAFPIGFVISHVILAVIFFGVIAPVGMALRLVGREPVTRRFDGDAASYWSEARPERDAPSYFKQY